MIRSRSSLWRAGLLGWGLALSTGCATGVSIQVLEPAQVMVPAHVRNVAVIDRSHLVTGGGRAFGLVEGLLTGEQLGADSSGRQAAIQEVSRVLSASPRFVVTAQSVPPEQFQSDLREAELGPGAVRRLGHDLRCEGLVSLEFFDSDTNRRVERKSEESTDSDGKRVVTVYFEAEASTDVRAVWRLYDVHAGTVVDFLPNATDAGQWSERRETEDEAVSALPDQTQAVTSVATQLGHAYGRRIAPTYVNVVRYIYGSGHDALKQARDMVRVNDWAGASRAWEGLRGDSSPKVRGKALYNLAVAREVDGDLQNALALAREGCGLYSKNRCRQYVGILEQRIADRARVQQQMAPPPPPPAHQPPPPPR